MVSASPEHNVGAARHRLWVNCWFGVSWSSIFHSQRVSRSLGTHRGETRRHRAARMVFAALLAAAAASVDCNSSCPFASPPHTLEHIQTHQRAIKSGERAPIGALPPPERRAPGTWPVGVLPAMVSVHCHAEIYFSNVERHECIAQKHTNNPSLHVRIYFYLKTP